ncbi:MAG TPA: bifunctional adenosylcobinamide kinase/adenosylcobinamide-phosphate guanylyltransferase [Chitinophagaceae bacterium]|nr:bifunctional adenosylcobinamide kinase/adenosylcobinamide-phosphate guanylyltransferase [Chitinophagaceae bacterium]
MITMITGGARSGKSRYAQEEALRLSGHPLYVATARRYKDDEEFGARIARHEAERDGRWETIEEQTAVSRLPLAGRVVVVDCVTLWLTNFFSRHGYETEPSLREFKEEIDRLRETDARLFIITNEIGMGVHAETAIGRRFTDLQGWANQYLAACAAEVVLLVSGLPLTVKRAAL